MNRRTLLQLGLFSGTTLITTLGNQAWVAHSQVNQPNPKRLVVVFLRGAVDGLNVVIPHFENSYYDERSLIAIPEPNQTNGALNLDNRFGLHPALNPLMTFWKQKNLAFVHAAGSPNNSRSHFDAQDYMESGTPGIKSTSDGWMNRLLANLPNKSPVQAVNVGNTTPRILTGAKSVATLPTQNTNNRPLPIDQPIISQAFNQLYSGNDPLSKAYREGIEARQRIMSSQDQEDKMANRGAPLANQISRSAAQLAQLMRRDSSVQLAFLAIGGWDTHINQGGVNGQLARNLKSLSDALNTLINGIGSIYKDTVIIVLSEFGRTIKENGNGGTDHGHGNVIWLLGGPIKGGKIYGTWPTLAPSARFEGRDLAVTTDFRDVISSVLTKHLQLTPSKINQIFPKYTARSINNIL